jgi:predicted transposase/invertase (TIGR01784 family)
MAETDDEEPQAQDAESGVAEQSQKHDEGYKSILSDTSNFLHLLRKYFASAPWIAELLSADVEAVRIDKSYITKEFRRVDSDLIYKLRKGNTDIYFYVLLELQSKVDYTMPFRLLRYMVELLSDVFQNTDKKVRERKDFRLPAIVPMVLYDGDNRWTAVGTYREYTEDYEIFGDNIINFKYLLLDLNRTDDDAILPVVKLLDAVFSLAKMRFEKKLLPKEINAWWVEQTSRLSKDDTSKLVDWMTLAFRAPIEIKNSFINTVEKGDVNAMSNIFQLIANDIEEEAMQKGKQAGRLEEALRFANFLKAKGFSVDEIAEATGLTVDEIIRL